MTADCTEGLVLDAGEPVAEAIRQVRPHAVDVASGVESGTPGRKDLAKVKAFIAAVRETADAN